MIIIIAYQGIIGSKKQSVQSSKDKFTLIKFYKIYRHKIKYLYKIYYFLLLIFGGVFSKCHLKHCVHLKGHWNVLAIQSTEWLLNGDWNATEIHLSRHHSVVIQPPFSHHSVDWKVRFHPVMNNTILWVIFSNIYTSVECGHLIQCGLWICSLGDLKMFDWI